jgi:hypothetical protein
MGTILLLERTGHGAPEEIRLSGVSHRTREGAGMRVRGEGGEKRVLRNDAYRV